MKKPDQEILREAEIRPDNLTQEIKAFYESDLRWLIAHKDRFVYVFCPACNYEGSEPALLKNDLQYVRCRSCATVYVNPRPSVELLDEFYAQSKAYDFWNKHTFPASEEARRKKLIRPRVERIEELCQKYEVKRDLLLEIGPGFGTFAEECMRSQFFKETLVVEANPELAETCRKKGIKVINSLIEQAELKRKADVIASFEVIEHIFSPRQFVEGCCNTLSAGGLLVLTCPNVLGFDNLALWKYSTTFDHEHLNYFHPKSLAHLLSSCGLEVLETSTPGKLDAELVRSALMRGEVDMDESRFLRHLLLERWEECGDKFQQFLADNLLSGHMWIVAAKK